MNIRKAGRRNSKKLTVKDNFKHKVLFNNVYILSTQSAQDSKLLFPKPFS